MKSKTNLVLSVKPFCRGFAFALFEDPQSPADWGVKDIRGRAKNALMLSAFKQLIIQYQPDVLVLPKPEGRSDRIRKLINAIAETEYPGSRRHPRRHPHYFRRLPAGCRRCRPRFLQAHPLPDRSGHRQPVRHVRAAPAETASPVG